MSAGRANADDTLLMMRQAALSSTIDMVDHLRDEREAESRRHDEHMRLLQRQAEALERIVELIEAWRNPLA